MAMSDDNDESEPERDACVFVARTTTFAEARFALGVCAEAYHVSTFSDGLYVEIDGGEESFVIHTQVVAGSVRYDFVFFEVTKDDRRGKAILIVEIDDPSHWRDQHKSAADKVRDRDALRLSKVPTMRFSNDELSGDGFRRCAKEALSCVCGFLSERSQMVMDGWSNGYNHGKERALKELECPSKEEKVLLS